MEYVNPFRPKLRTHLECQITPGNRFSPMILFPGRAFAWVNFDIRGLSCLNSIFMRTALSRAHCLYCLRPEDALHKTLESMKTFSSSPDCASAVDKEKKKSIKMEANVTRRAVMP